MSRPVQPRLCLNCGAELAGSFCSSCGQRDVPPYPSVRELVVDAFSELSGWDGRFATTVRSLITHPGKLTREFLEGRRARYISPLRLYLMCSLLYFLGAAAAPDVRLDDGRTVFLGLRVTSDVKFDSATSRPERVGGAATESFRTQQPLDEVTRREVLADIDRAPSLVQPMLRRAITDPGGFKRSMLEGMPRMLFLLLPVFAGIVALFYRARKYPEHLYFAIHLHAYTFLALALVQLVKFTRAPVLVGVVAVLASLSVLIYATVAFRHAYGGTIITTVAKEVGIGAIYFLTTIVAFMVLIYTVSVMG